MDCIKNDTRGRRPHQEVALTFAEEMEDLESRQRQEQFKRSGSSTLRDHKTHSLTEMSGLRMVEPGVMDAEDEGCSGSHGNVHF